MWSLPIKRANTPIASVIKCLLSPPNRSASTCTIWNAFKKPLKVSCHRRYSGLTEPLFFLSLAHIDPIEREIRELAESIFAIKDEQEYIVARERQHRDSK